jgi:putative metallohydrolase (TIGR04338 family)
MTVLTVRRAPQRDLQRARVYRAESAWGDRLDAARVGARMATVAGSAVLLPAERRFGTLAAVEDYAADVVTRPEVTALGHVVPAPAVRVRRGVTAAHWEAPGVLALPVPRHGEPWALRESVVLHELAHHVGHVTGLAWRHNPPYPAVMLLLVRAVLGDEAAFALDVAYGDERVRVGQV